MTDTSNDPKVQVSFKSAFLTGLVILLPITLTITILSFIFNFLTDPFTGVVEIIMQHAAIFQGGFLFLTQDQLIAYTSRLLILVAVVIFTIILGLLARWFFVNYLISLGEAILIRIPFISTIYKTSQDVINTLFSSNAQSFKQVVLVPYPNERTYAIGLVTREDIEGPDGNLVSVFVPTTPNPTSGFLMLYKHQQLTYLDMTVENAIKYVVSCGVISSPIEPLSPKELKEKIENQAKETLL